MLVMTGGLGPGDRATEAEAARLWSLAQGVPPEAIAVETRSRTTQENLAFARPILARHGLRTVLLVSDPLHMRRSVAIARRLGIEAAPSPTPTTRYTGWRSWTWFLGARPITWCAAGRPGIAETAFQGIPRGFQGYFRGFQERSKGVSGGVPEGDSSRVFQERSKGVSRVNFSGVSRERSLARFITVPRAIDQISSFALMAPPA
jgi:hypothetical protein